MFLCEKTTKYEEKTRTKSAKTAISGIFPAFSAFNFFLEIQLGHILGIAFTHLCAKNRKKLMIKSRANAEKPVFPAYFRYFRPEKYFVQKPGSVTFWASPFCIIVQKNQKKLMSQSREKLVTDERTDERTSVNL